MHAPSPTPLPPIAFVTARVRMLMLMLTPALLLMLALAPAHAVAQGTAFTYQGRLADQSRPANGSYDLQFSLFPQASGGTRIGAVLSFPSTPVVNGLFNLSLDFGQGAFNGSDRWVEIAVRTNGAATFTTLTPRRSLAASNCLFLVL